MKIDYKRTYFTLNGDSITNWEAVERLYACDSEWSKEAFIRMCRIIDRKILKQKIL